MEVKNIILFVIIVLLLIIVISYIMRDVNTLTGLTSAKTSQQIEPDKLTSSSSKNTSNFTYSIWFFIDDWNYRYGEAKVIFGRMTTGSGEKEPCPSVVLGPIQNNILKKILNI